MPLSPKSLAGPGYVILNALRVMNIVSLLAVIVACAVMLVKIVVDSHFFFFDATTHVITSFVSIFLIVSELTLFRGYFARNWPLLSPTHGFVALGLAMEILGVNMLANLNKPELSQQNMGIAFWRIVIGSGVLVIVFGAFNIIASYIFRDRNLGVTARQVRAKGAVALAEQKQTQKQYTFSEATRTEIGTSSTPRIKTPNTSTKSPIRFPQFGRQPTLPVYTAAPAPRPTSSLYSERGDLKGKEISGPIGINPQFAHLVRPDSAYHPSRR